MRHRESRTAPPRSPGGTVPASCRGWAPIAPAPCATGWRPRVSVAPCSLASVHEREVHPQLVRRQTGTPPDLREVLCLSLGPSLALRTAERLRDDVAHE